MAVGLIQGASVSLRLNTGTFILSIASSTPSSGIAVVGNRFTLNSLGAHFQQISLVLAGNGKDVPVRFQLYNVTLASESAGQDLIAPVIQNPGLPYCFQLPFTVTNVAHQYEYRLVVRNNNAPSLLTTAVLPTFQAFLENINCLGTGTVTGTGTTNRVSKWTNGPGGVLGDSSISDDGALVTVANPVALGDNQLRRPQIRDYAMTTTTVGASGAALALNMELGNVFDVTMDQNCVFTFTNPPAAGQYGKLILFLRGAWAPTFPGAVIWSGGGGAPGYATPALYAFLTVDAGAVWFGMQGGNAFA
jgi:hypothetical protein